MDVPRPLFVTNDPDILDNLLRLSAAASVEPTVAHTTAHATRDWSRAPLVVVGSDLSAPLAELAPEPHPNVTVVGCESSLNPAENHPTVNADPRLHARTVLSLPRDEALLTELLADSLQSRAGRSLAISVVGGRGGAGASVLAIALAMAGQRARLDTVLIDADPLGSGLDLMMGSDDVLGTHWAELAAREGRMNWPALREALPQSHRVSLLTWERGFATPVPAAAMRAVLSSALRGSDLVVLDLPRSLDSAAEEALRRSGATLLAVPADLHSVMSAQRVAERLREHTADPRVVVRGGSPLFPAETVSTAVELPLAGEIPTSRGVRNALDAGIPPARQRGTPLAKFADEFVTQLGERPARPELSE